MSPYAPSHVKGTSCSAEPRATLAALAAERRCIGFARCLPRAFRGPSSSASEVKGLNDQLLRGCRRVFGFVLS